MGGGVGYPDPEIRGGPGLQKNVLWPFRPQFGIKISGGGTSWAPPLDSPLQMVYPTDVSDIILPYNLQCLTLRLVH